MSLIGLELNRSTKSPMSTIRLAGLPSPVTTAIFDQVCYSATYPKTAKIRAAGEGHYCKVKSKGFIMGMSFASAERSARAAMEHAAGLGIAICVAVCDAQGRLIVFFKMDGTSALLGHEAIRRAITSAGTGLPSDRAAHELNRAKSTSEEGLGTSFMPGGIPLIVDEERIGSVGVCGGTAAQDVDCSGVGAAAFSP